jgi:hypothetical protein
MIELNNKLEQGLIDLLRLIEIETLPNFDLDGRDN